MYKSLKSNIAVGCLKNLRRHARGVLSSLAESRLFPLSPDPKILIYFFSVFLADRVRTPPPLAENPLQYTKSIYRRSFSDLLKFE